MALVVSSGWSCDGVSFGSEKREGDARMGFTVPVPLSGNREGQVHYEWGLEPGGTSLVVRVMVDHDTSSGLTPDDQLAVLDAVREAVRDFS